MGLGLGLRLGLVLGLGLGLGSGLGLAWATRPMKSFSTCSLPPRQLKAAPG